MTAGRGLGATPQSAADFVVSDGSGIEADPLLEQPHEGVEVVRRSR